MAINSDIAISKVYFFQNISIVLKQCRRGGTGDLDVIVIYDCENFYIRVGMADKTALGIIELLLCALHAQCAGFKRVFNKV